jgi:1-acyl-sn-glycerol-3-phosphate acyltransferase
MSLSYSRSLLITDPIIILATIVMGSISLLTSLIDPNATYVFVANHRSFMDIPVLLAYLPLQFRFLAKKGLFLIPFLGTHLRRARHLPVVKDNPRASLKSMTDAAHILREPGMSVMLFPEGGRSKDGMLQDFIEGAAYIAVKAGVPIIPLAMTGTREVLPMGSLQIMSGIVELRIGDPIPTANLTLKDRATLTQTMHDQVADLLRSASQPQGAR